MKTITKKSEKLNSGTKTHNKLHRKGPSPTTKATRTNSEPKRQQTKNRRNQKIKRTLQRVAILVQLHLTTTTKTQNFFRMIDEKDNKLVKDHTYLTSLYHTVANMFIVGFKHHETGVETLRFYGGPTKQMKFTHELAADFVAMTERKTNVDPEGGLAIAYSNKAEMGRFHRIEKPFTIIHTFYFGNDMEILGVGGSRGTTAVFFSNNKRQILMYDGEMVGGNDANNVDPQPLAVIEGLTGSGHLLDIVYNEVVNRIAITYKPENVDGLILNIFEIDETKTPYEYKR